MSSHGEAKTQQKAGVALSRRFTDVPSTLDIPVHLDQKDEDDADAVEIYLENLSDPNELCAMLETEHAAPTYWKTIALAYAKQSKIDYAIETLIRGRNVFQGKNHKGTLSILSCLCWMYIWKSRTAPRLAPEGVPESDAKTKEHFLQQAVAASNHASRINPSFPPLILARGVLSLLRASLQAPPKSAVTGKPFLDSEKAQLLHVALKSFEEAYRVSRGRNMLALIGKAKALFSLGKYPEALEAYQEVLSRMPDFVDPDPRIGIGCCLWNLGFKDDARAAWERSLEVNPKSKIAATLLGIYYFDASRKLPVESPEFVSLYKKAITEYVQKSYQQDPNVPLTCVTFANYFFSRKAFTNVDGLSNKAIQYTDINAIASDGWYLLGRKEHYLGNLDSAMDCYRRADDARGGSESGFLPAQIGTAQAFILRNDLGEAKLRLDKIFQRSRSYEAATILGTIFAEEAFSNNSTSLTDTKSAQRAIQLLEFVRTSWKDSKRNHSPDVSVLLNLARLYETNNPSKALQCLLQVEQVELDQLADSDDHIEAKRNAESESALRNHLRDFISPQLTNNIGCLHFQTGSYELASEMFESGLRACMRLGKDGNDVDGTVDTLVATISFNLGRSYEARGLVDNAIEVYERVLTHHEHYTDAQIRLAYIHWVQSPHEKGRDSVTKLFEQNTTDLEVRALYGWYLGKEFSWRRTNNHAESPELRHHKHTLQQHDKHDRYALVGMGTIYLQIAREMKRSTDLEKQKRSAMYSKAVEFFDKTLQLDPQNAYAAQGVAIALIEDRKDFQAAFPILSKVRDALGSAYVYANIGHLFSEMKQHSRAIENYEIALSKSEKSKDPTIQTCLGRAWLHKAKASGDLSAYQMALEYSQKALDAVPDQVHLKFNVAFVQIQLAAAIYSSSETNRSLQQVQEVANDLESAIAALEEIAVHPQCPYPKDEIDQRATMARNTLRKQLERAIANQRDYEEKNKELLRTAREKHQAMLRRREQERQEASEKERERLAKIKKEREELAIRDRELAEQRMEKERASAAADMTTDSETGAQIRKKRKASKSKREKKAKNGSGMKGAESDGAEEDEPLPKKRRLMKADSTKYKSAEIVVDSDDDNLSPRVEMKLDDVGSPESEDAHTYEEDPTSGVESASVSENEELESTNRHRRRKRGKAARVVDESDEDE